MVRFSNKNAGWDLTVEGVSMLLGYWWLQAAQRGNLETIPLVNVSPEFQEKPPADKSAQILLR